MKTNQVNSLGLAMKDFFWNYLPRLRGMSAHTILSYRDSIKLFLEFLAIYKQKPVSRLQAEDMRVPEVIAFLDYLESSRHNGAATRNVRLAALHTFFRHLSGTHPEYLHQAQQVLNIPFKRTSTRAMEYLEFEEITAVLDSIDRSKADGRRDYALLSIMFNTGGRAQEILDIKATDLHLSRPFYVHLFGKGRKERICPLWPETTQLLRDYAQERGIDLSKPTSFFTNHLGRPLTRFGLRYILKKHLRNASEIQRFLKAKRLHPHSMRHSAAIHLLKSGVDLSSIANWLGHASVNTTNKYATMDLEMKRQAIERAKPLNEKYKENLGSWRNDSDLIAWLEAL
ncbi:MAG: tyrosine-type recombinase/integrase [Thermodesulfobacteriota bacterium]